MSKVGAALTGVAASAVIGVGAVGMEFVGDIMERNEIAECIVDFEDDEQTFCINSVQATYDKEGWLQMIQLTGLVGVIGCGYLGYKATKEEIGTTGIIEDHVDHIG